MTTRDKGITLPIYSFYKTDITGLSVTDVAGDYTVQNTWRFGQGIVTPVTLVNSVFNAPASLSLRAQSANPAFAAVGGSIVLNPGVGSLGNSSGNLTVVDNAGFGGAWNTSHLVLGTSHFWVDTKFRLRFKVGAPVNDTDGPTVGISFTGSAVYDPPNILAGASITTTIAVAGVALGDAVDGVSFSLDQQGILFSGYVSAANIVTVILFNRTAAAIDLASGTLRVFIAAGT